MPIDKRLFRYFFAALLTPWMLVVTARIVGGQDDMRPMFNGKDFSGWVRTNTPSQTWTYQDDVVACSGTPIGEIRTDKMYQNFIMELEWRHMVPKGNAGVFIWADDITARGVPFHRGIEVQVLENAYGDTKSHTTHGDIFPIHGATMTPVNGRGGGRAFPIENRFKPSPEWNHYRIEGRDGEISLAVNGKIVTRGKNCVPRKGYICLESEGGVVQYRNVRIQELPATDLAPENVAIADRGYRSLYTGLDLEGWQLPKSETRWHAQDWVLSFQGESGETSRLVSTEKFEHIGFVVDVRLKSESSNLVIEVGPNHRVDLSDPLVAMHLEAVGSWNRIESAEAGGVRSIWINGKQLVNQDTSRGSSDDAMVLVPTGAVEICNVYARSQSPSP